MEKQRAKRLLLNSSENEELVGSGQKQIRKQIGVFELSANHDSGQPIYKNEVSFDVLESAVASDFSSTIANREPSKKWMAFERSEPNDKPKITNPTCNFDNPNGKLSSTSQIEAHIAERTAEWGLVVKTDVEGGFKVSTMDSKLSGDGEIEKEKLSDRFVFGLESTRTSEESNSFEGGFPRVSQELKDALETLQQIFVVSDATEPDCPIIYASSGFFSMTGYSSKDIIGRNCQFLQGPETDRNEVAKIKNSVKNGTSYCGRLLNYKKDGTPFWNLLTITPIKDDRGNTIKFIGMQVEVSKCTEEVNDKALRPNGLPKSSIRYDARQKAKALMSMDEVIQTVKHPRSHIRDMSNDINGKHEEQDRFNLDYVLPESADAASMSTAGRKTPQFDSKSDVSCVSSSQDAGKQLRKSARISLMGFKGRPSSSTSKPEEKLTIEPEILKTNQVECTKNWELSERESDIRKGIDLATTLERIEKNFVISDPRLPDNPIIYASDSFLELTGYTREEILGRNCRFLQGTETDQVTVSKIRDAIRKQGEITVQLINYTNSGKKFWNLFHLQPMREQMGELQYFIGVQLDGSCQVEPLRNCLSEKTEQQSAKLVKATAVNVDEAVRELPDANLVFFYTRCFMDVHLSGEKTDRKHLPTSCTRISHSQAAFR